MPCQKSGKNRDRHQFKNLAGFSGLFHGVYTRHGGVSQPPFDSLNVSWNVGDEEERVRCNLLKIQAEMGVDVVVGSPQVHGDEVHIIDEAAVSSCAGHHPLLITPPGDALVTRLKGVGLLIKVADCQSILLLDPVSEAIANVHSGWRGSVAEIVKKTVSIMAERLDADPSSMLAAIGPSLGPCCAEFVNHERELPKSFLDFQVRPNHFDFWAITRRQLMDAGLKEENIEIAGRCTVCEKENFFSYRGLGETGRLASVIGWKPVH